MFSIGSNNTIIVLSVNIPSVLNKAWRGWKIRALES